MTKRRRQYARLPSTSSPSPPPARSRTLPPAVEIDPNELRSPAALERRELYMSPRWKALRSAMLNRAKCRVCGRRATVLDHFVGHEDEQARRVASHLGMNVAATWQDRFWTGPFICLCHNHHSAKTAREQRGELLQWVLSLDRE